MTLGNFTTKTGVYLRQHWFKIGLAILFVLLLTKKDLSFNINLRTPARPTAPAQSAPPQPAQKAKQREVLTDELHSPATMAEARPKSELFNLSLFRKKADAPQLIRQLDQMDEAVIAAYFKRFARVAVSESNKFGIPASIILANALLLSQSGAGTLATAQHNHFALPCTPDWEGPQAEHQGFCYRSYENAWTSFRDHSFYITTGAYGHLRKLPATNYKSWAKALEKAGFAKEKDLAKQLIQLIERYDLHKLDQ